MWFLRATSIFLLIGVSLATPQQFSHLDSLDGITPPPKVRRGCGISNADNVSSTIPGYDDQAKFDEFPWMVIIWHDDFSNTGENAAMYHCGGALIHPQAVLTAAHHVKGREASSLKVRVGEWDVQTENNTYPHQDREVQAVVIHEEFNRTGTADNDFAILILKTPVDLAINVDVVCLPEEGDEFDGARCFASGWGKDSFGILGMYHAILKKIELPIVPHNKCQDSLRTIGELGRFFELHETFICAGGDKGKDTCTGDGGSPLVCPLINDPSRYVQVGIVAWGIGCGRDKIPAVYAKTASARHWIDDKIDSYNLDRSVYEYRS